MRTLSRFAWHMPILALATTGCLSRTAIVNNSAHATEERMLTAVHVAGAGLDVRTLIGSVDVVADSSLKEVSVVAKITASAETEHEAKARLAQVSIKLDRRADKVLEIGVEFPKTSTNHAGVSFTVRVPEASGVTAKSGNGSVTLKGLGGDADAKSDIGAVRVVDQNGNVTATSGNGSVTVERAVGGVHAKSSIGAVTVKEAGGDVYAKSRNGSVTVSAVRGSVMASSDIGSVSIVEAAGAIDAQSGNGSVHCEPAAGSSAPFHLKSSIGGITAKLPAGFGGRIKAETSIGSITVKGPRQPASVSGEKHSKTIVLSNDGPESKVSTGNGSITITVN